MILYALSTHRVCVHVALAFDVIDTKLILHFCSIVQGVCTTEFTMYQQPAVPTVPSMYGVQQYYNNNSSTERAMYLTV